ncbi:MAG: twin transmembrane helix small protein [Rubrivivax sp.]|nr:twin transmembrane helix small protein [Rubrivivax sp.]
MKTVMVLMMVAVLGALASAGVFMLRRGPPDAEGKDGNKPANKQMARALALRVGLSVALFLFILLSWYMGWVRPTGVPLGR